MTENNDLCFRVIDSLENSYETIIKKNQNILDFRNPFYLNCEIGTKDKISFLRINLNGEMIDQRIINKTLNISLDNQLLKTMIVGGDIKLSHGGIFKLQNFLICSTTHDFANRNKVAKLFEQGYKSPWVIFNGNLILDHTKMGIKFKDNLVTK